MTLSERTLNIDDESGNPLDVSELIVGGLGDLLKTMRPTQDLTGALHENPKRKKTGFYAGTDSGTLQIEKTAATKAAFYTSYHLNTPRTATYVPASGEQFQIELEITESKMLTESGENAIDVIEFAYTTTGAPSIT